jgi:hypothetical protein
VFTERSTCYEKKKVSNRLILLTEFKQKNCERKEMSITGCRPVYWMPKVPPDPVTGVTFCGGGRREFGCFTCSIISLGGYWARKSEWEPMRAAMEGRSFYKLPAVLRWFSSNIGYHHVHHLSPRIPNYLFGAVDASKSNITSSYSRTQNIPRPVKDPKSCGHI